MLATLPRSRAIEPSGRRTATPQAPGARIMTPSIRAWPPTRSSASGEEGAGAGVGFAAMACFVVASVRRQARRPLRGAAGPVGMDERMGRGGLGTLRARRLGGRGPGLAVAALE